MGRLAVLIMIGVATLALSDPIHSAERSVTLSVEMSCPTCPFIVKKSLERVEGVQSVTVSYKEQTAIVRYDDETVDAVALQEATGRVGMPSKVTN